MSKEEAQNALFSTYLNELVNNLPDHYTKMNETTGEEILVYSKQYILDRM